MSSFLAVPRIARELVWTRPNFGRGTQGFDAKRVQEWLCLHGFRTAIDGDYGPATEARVRAFQQSRKLEITGTASIETLAALVIHLRTVFSYETEAKTVREAIVLTARRHAVYHPREVGGDNRGPWVRAYCGHDGAPYAWCAGAATTIVAQAAAMLDVQPPIPHELGCDQLADLARKAGRLTHDPARVRPGDLFLLQNRKNHRDIIHTGIVTAMHPDYMDTIEGNTNDEGSRNGYELVPRTRGLARMDYVLMG